MTAPADGSPVSVQPDLPEPPAGRWAAWVPPLVLAALALAVHGTRLTTLPLRGEETRRATVAVEILATGDWVVPRQQGRIYLSRPPAGSWPMAALGLLRGGVDDFAVRGPTVAAVVLTTLLIYWYAIRLLPGCGAFCAAAGFAGMFQVLRFGRLAETEATFTLLVAASLLGWHGLKVRGRAPWLCWSVGYALAGLAGLTKGPQGPIYFVAGSWAFCLLKRDWRMLLGRGHLTGMLGFAATAGLWQGIYVSRAGWANGIDIWRSQSAGRFHWREPATAVAHWFAFPLAVFACTLPGSLFVPALLSKRVRRLTPGAGDALLFCGASTLLMMAPVWLAPGGMARYVMPCYPLIAVLGGAAVEGLRRAATQPATTDGDALLTRWRTVRNACLTAGAVALPIGAILFVMLSGARPELAVMNQSAAADLLLILAFALAGALFWASRGGSARWTGASAAALTAAAGVAYAGAFITARSAVAIDARTELAAAMETVPPDARFVSVGPLTHAARYYLRERADADPRLAPLAILTTEEAARAAAEPGAAPLYYCADLADWPLPPGSEALAEVPLGRNRRAPQQVIRFGRVDPPPMHVAAGGKAQFSLISPWRDVSATSPKGKRGGDGSGPRLRFGLTGSRHR